MIALTSFWLRCRFLASTLASASVLELQLVSESDSVRRWRLCWASIPFGAGCVATIEFGVWVGFGTSVNLAVGFGMIVDGVESQSLCMNWVLLG